MEFCFSDLLKSIFKKVNRLVFRLRIQVLCLAGLLTYQLVKMSVAVQFGKGKQCQMAVSKYEIENLPDGIVNAQCQPMRSLRRDCGYLLLSNWPIFQSIQVNWEWFFFARHQHQKDTELPNLKKKQTSESVMINPLCAPIPFLCLVLLFKDQEASWSGGIWVMCCTSEREDPQEPQSPSECQNCNCFVMIIFTRVAQGVQQGWSSNYGLLLDYCFIVTPLFLVFVRWRGKAL